MRILVVDDEEIKRVSLVDDLSACGHEAIAAAAGEEALKLMANREFDVVVTDLRMEGIDGMELLQRIKSLGAVGPEVVIMTAYGSIPMAVEAMKIGAFDFITKPFRNETILPLLRRIEKKNVLRTAWAQSGAGVGEVEHKIIGNSSAMLEIRRMIKLCARTEVTVLLTGETGTGKDLVAKTIHDISHRQDKPFVKVNCAVFPRGLIENELYGHEAGSYTGADKSKKGKFDAAQGGTLYLDDVDDIPLEQQIKLLRVIEEKMFERVGAVSPVVADVRVIAATKKNLLLEVEKGAFRSDLYYRLNVLRINLPPLRDNLDDLPVLVDYLLRRIMKERSYYLDDEAMEFLRSHDWPGNVRELAHALERAYMIGNGTITSDLLARDMVGLAGHRSGDSHGFKFTVEQAERKLLQEALRKAQGNKSAAARSLGMKLSTFRDKLGKHNL